MLPVSLDFPFLIAPSVFSNFYLLVAMKPSDHMLHCPSFTYGLVYIGMFVIVFYKAERGAVVIVWINDYLCNQYLSPLTL